MGAQIGNPNLMEPGWAEFEDAFEEIRRLRKEIARLTAGASKAEIGDMTMGEADAYRTGFAAGLAAGSSGAAE
ncbi:hypothetical protein [Falsiroseomonas sp. CW058]|uniref:hypothetical protein n=1 Tax=Falsiroseomonas sp. CW058 TaxID=3388664 RepID=UPI003D31D806